jgi:hypothetical protein
MKFVYIACASILVGFVGGYCILSNLRKPVQVPTTPSIVFTPNLNASQNIEEHSTFSPPPRDLIIKGERWYLVSTDFKGFEGVTERTQAETNCPKRVIYYRDSIENRASLRTVVWHEVLHAANCRIEDDIYANWIGDVKDSPTHHAVYLMGMFLADFGMSNPDFLEWAK